jgi:hypothetical protein
MVCKILSPPFAESIKVPVMAGTIARVLVLRHDALKAHLARVCEHERAAAAEI